MGVTLLAARPAEGGPVAEDSVFERIQLLSEADPAEIDAYAAVCQRYTQEGGLETLIGNYTGHLALHQQIIRPALARTVRPGDRVLDFACGTGRVTPLLVEAASPGGVVVGVDVSWPALSRAALIVQRAAFMLIGGNGEIPMPPWSCDVIVSLVAIQHIQFFPVRHRYFLTFRRLLREGGRLLIQLNADASGSHITWFERGTPNIYEAPDVVCDELDMAAYLPALGFRVLETWRTEMDSMTASWFKRPTGTQDGWLWVLAEKVSDG